MGETRQKSALALRTCTILLQGCLDLFPILVQGYLDLVTISVQSCIDPVNLLVQHFRCPSYYA